MIEQLERDGRKAGDNKQALAVRIRHHHIRRLCKSTEDEETKQEQKATTIREKGRHKKRGKETKYWHSKVFESFHPHTCTQGVEKNSSTTV
jgi:hypothetical protein